MRQVKPNFSVFLGLKNIIKKDFYFKQILLSIWNFYSTLIYCIQRLRGSLGSKNPFVKSTFNEKPCNVSLTGWEVGEWKRKASAGTTGLKRSEWTTGVSHTWAGGLSSFSVHKSVAPAVHVALLKGDLLFSFYKAQ